MATEVLMYAYPSIPIVFMLVFSIHSLLIIYKCQGGSWWEVGDRVFLFFIGSATFSCPKSKVFVKK